MRKLSEFVSPTEDYEPFPLDLEDGSEPVLFKHSQFDWAAQQTEDLVDGNKFSEACRLFLGDDFQRAWKVLGKMKSAELGELLNEVRDHFRVQHDARASQS